MEFSQYLDNLEKKLIGSFDLERDYILEDYRFDLFARYLLRNEKYILLKQAKIYAIENNEYSFIKYFDSMDLSLLDKFTASLIKSIDSLVQPSEEHMSSIITGVIVLQDNPSPELVNAVKRFKYHKGFAFGFRGWVDIRLLLVTMDQDYIVTNKKGKEVSKVYSIDF